MNVHIIGSLVEIWMHELLIYGGSNLIWIEILNGRHLRVEPHWISIHRILDISAQKRPQNDPVSLLESKLSRTGRVESGFVIVLRQR